MKKVKWFLKEKGIVREVKVADLLPYTSQDKVMKITEHNTKKETHKIVEFKS